jgi:hypothetical protein
MTALSEALRSWVRIPLDVRMFVCFYSVVAASRQADPPSKQSYQLCIKINK